MKPALLAILASFVFLAAETKRQSPSMPEQALKRYFPHCETAIKNLMLTDRLAQQVRVFSGITPGEKLISFYLSKQNQKIIAYGYVDIHTVRTQPETILYIIDSTGKLISVEALAFHEPQEYRPSTRWLNQFNGKSLDQNSLLLSNDIAAISGATLTSGAVTRNSRKALALWKVFFENKP